jgi:formamidopyrimidine-DNA glycosylase
MPELPDVEGFRRRVESNALHQTINHVSLPAPEMVKGLSATTLRHRLEGHAVDSVRRYGKHLLLEVHDSGWLDLHFGMSGFPQYVDTTEPTPRYTRMSLDLDHGQLAYVVPRKLGRIGMVDSLEKFIAERGLGIDALDPALDFETFRRLAHGKGIVKCWLMDQSQIAGIGNIYSDEILYHARIHPRQRAGDLDEKELKRLYQAISSVLAVAVTHGGDPARLPDSWILPHRRAGERCPSCTGKIQRLSLCGRSAYFCPSCQPS